MPSIILGGGKVDLTDRPNRQLGQINQIITVDAKRIVVCDTIPIYIGNIKRVYSNVPILEFVNSPQKVNLIKKYILELDGEIHYVDDIRHSQILEFEDTTYYGDTQGTLTIDYNSVITFKQVYIKCEATTSTTLFGIGISNDNTSYTTIFSKDGAGVYHLNFYNLTFRYLKFTAITVNPSLGPGGFKVYKIILVK